MDWIDITCQVAPITFFACLLLICAQRLHWNMVGRVRADERKKEFKFYEDYIMQNIQNLTETEIRRFAMYESGGKHYRQMMRKKTCLCLHDLPLSYQRIIERLSKNEICKSQH